jgi:hypothetical protein
VNQAVSLQDTEYRNFTGGSPSSVTFAPTAEIGFIQLDLSVEQGMVDAFSVVQNGQSNGHNSPIDGTIRHVQL